MFLNLIVLLAQISGGAGAGGSAVSAPPGKPAAVAKASDPNKVVCKDDSTAGQRITRKVCRPQVEWDNLAAGAEAYLRERRGNANPGRAY